MTVYNEYFYLVISSVSQLNLVKCLTSSELYGDMLSLYLFFEFVWFQIRFFITMKQ